MGHWKRLHSFAVCLLTAVALLACVIQAAPQVPITPAASPAPGAGPQATFSDPFAYCAALGTIDAPDSRYTGPKVPEAVAQGLKKAFGAPADAPLEPFLHNTFWRCMNGQVYACTVGANLPCQERADASRRPTPGMTNFCKDDPQAEVIPAVATGRATVYEWKCIDGVPEVVRQFAQPDARGFLSHIWYAISPD
ncbi:MAG: hypothetical protein ACRERE_43690 [Candidatus Entotheonellia bacterium]